ncbi:MAG: hypothetical protein AABZ39_16370, partial [Spirochaetota bacterium]
MARKALFNGDLGPGAGIIIAAAVAFIPAKGEHTYILFNHIMLFLFLFTLLFAVVFNKHILPRIDERVILIISIIFVYRLLDTAHSYPSLSPFFLTCAIPTAIMTCAVLLNAFIPRTPPRWLKVVFYAWYLLMAGGIIAMQFPCGNFFRIIVEDNIATLDIIELVTAGMTLVYLSVNFMNAWLLIPIPSKGQSWESRLNDLRDHIDLLNSKYSDDQGRPWQTAVIMILCAAVIAAQELILQTRDSLFANIGLLIVYFMFGQLPITRTRTG